MGEHFSEFKIAANCFKNLTCWTQSKKKSNLLCFYLNIFRCYAVLISFFYDTNKTKRFLNCVLLLFFQNRRDRNKENLVNISFYLNR